MELTQKEKDKVLENFMKEFFPFNEFKKIGLFTKEMKGDYKAQADRVCEFLGLESIYHYGAFEGRVHLTFADPNDKTGLSTGERNGEPFVTVIQSIYE